MFLILICRDLLPGINFEGSDLAWGKIILHILQYKRWGSERKYFWRNISVKLEITFFNLFKVWLGECQLCLYGLVLQSRSVAGVPVVVWVCTRVIGAKSVVMLVNDMKIECNTYLSRFFFQFEMLSLFELTNVSFNMKLLKLWLYLEMTTNQFNTQGKNGGYSENWKSVLEWIGQMDFRSLNCSVIFSPPKIGNNFFCYFICQCLFFDYQPPKAK